MVFNLNYHTYFEAYASHASNCCMLLAFDLRLLRASSLIPSSSHVTDSHDEPSCLDSGYKSKFGGGGRHRNCSLIATKVQIYVIRCPRTVIYCLYSSNTVSLSTSILCWACITLSPLLPSSQSYFISELFPADYCPSKKPHLNRKICQKWY